jgi:3-oxoacyl-[acyl-carrier-protein] synthase-3
MSTYISSMGRFLPGAPIDNDSMEAYLQFDVEFLRWMLSDGAGAAVLQTTPATRGLCLVINWIELKSCASRFPPCMYVGPEKNRGRLASWLDYPSVHAAADDGAINLRQDVRMLL